MIGFQTVFVKKEFINSKNFIERIEDLTNEFGINVECLERKNVPRPQRP